MFTKYVQQVVWYLQKNAPWKRGIIRLFDENVVYIVISCISTTLEFLTYSFDWILNPFHHAGHWNPFQKLCLVDKFLCMWASFFIHVDDMTSWLRIQCKQPTCMLTHIPRAADQLHSCADPIDRYDKFRSLSISLSFSITIFCVFLSNFQDC